MPFVVGAGQIPKIIGVELCVAALRTNPGVYLPLGLSLDPDRPVLGWFGLNDHDAHTVSTAVEDNLRQLVSAKTGDDCSLALLLDRDPSRRFSVQLPHPQSKETESETAIKSPRKLMTADTAHQLISRFLGEDDLDPWGDQDARAGGEIAHE